MDFSLSGLRTKVTIEEMFITFVLAFCSIIYEFLLSQILAAILGGTLFRYTTTIALYITALGVGAFLLDRWPRDDSRKRLCKVEFALAGLGAVAPLLAIFFDGIFSSVVVTATACYFLVFAVGVLSGIELPLLMRVAEEKSTGGGLKALAVDFFGTFLGCLLFPLVLLPQLGVFATASWIASINLAVAFYIVIKWQPKFLNRRSLNWALVGLSHVLVVVSFVPEFRHWMLERFYFQ